MSAVIDGVLTFRGESEDAASTIHVTHSSELMESYDAARVVDARGGTGLAAVRDERGDLAVFALTSKGHLFLIRRDAKSATGWAQTDLSVNSAEGAVLTVDRFDVSQAGDGEVTVYAMSGGALYFRTLLSSWTKHAFQPKGPVTLLKVGQREGAGQPLVVLMVKDSSEVMPHILNIPRPLPTFAVNVKRVIDAVPGNAFSQTKRRLCRGIFALCELPDGSRTIIFLGQAGDYDMQLTIEATEIAAKANVLAVVPNRGLPERSDLYVAGEGIWRFDAHDLKGAAERVAAVDHASNITVLNVRSDASGTTVTAQAESKLLHISKDASGRWTHPAPVHTGIAGAAPIRNRDLQTDEMVVNIAGELVRSALDPYTHRWDDTKITVGDDGNLQIFHCYTTQLHVENGEGQALANETFELQSSDWVDATINGKAAVLDPKNGKPLTVKTDGLGNIAIVQKATGTIATPIFTLTKAGAPGSAPIDPATKTRDRLAAVKRAEDLRPWFKNSSADDLQAAARALVNLTDTAKNLPADGSKKKPSEPFTGSSEPWGLRFSPNGSIRFLDAEAAGAAFLAAQRRAIESPEFDFRTFFGDAMRIIRNVVEKVVDVVVKGVEGLITIGKTTIRFVVETVGQVVSAMNTVLEKLGAEIDKLVQWVGFVFDWDDILTTHKVMVNVADQTWNFALGHLAGFEKSVGGFFDMADKRIEAVTLPADVMNIEIFGKSRELTGIHDRHGTADFLTKSPVGTFASHQLMHVIPHDRFEVTLDGDFGDDVRKALEEILPESERRKIEATSRKLMTDVATIFKGGRITIGEALEVVKGLLRLPLQLARNAVVGLMKLARRLLEEFMKQLTAPMNNIPLLSAFYQHQVKRPFNVRDGLLLLAAIPATSAYKVFKGAAPFPNGKTYGLDTASASQLFRFGAAAESIDLTAGLKIYEKLGAIVAPWAGMLLRGFSAVGVLTGSIFAAILVAGTSLAISIATIPFSTPFPKDLSSPAADQLTWGSWLVGLAGGVLALFVFAVPLLQALIDALGSVVGFALTLASAVAQLTDPAKLAVLIVSVIESIVALITDISLLWLAVDEPTIKVIASIVFSIGANLDAGLGTVIAIMT